MMWISSRVCLGCWPVMHTIRPSMLSTVIWVSVSPSQIRSILISLFILKAVWTKLSSQRCTMWWTRMTSSTTWGPWIESVWVLSHMMASVINAAFHRYQRIRIPTSSCPQHHVVSSLRFQSGSSKCVHISLLRRCRKKCNLRMPSYEFDWVVIIDLCTYLSHEHIFPLFIFISSCQNSVVWWTSVASEGSCELLTQWENLFIDID